MLVVTIALVAPVSARSDDAPDAAPAEEDPGAGLRRELLADLVGDDAVSATWVIAQVDERRAEVGLEPLDEYLTRFSEACAAE